MLHETIRLTSYWEEQVRSTKFDEETFANVEVMRKHVQLTIQTMIDTEEEKNRKEKHMIKIKEELVSFEYLEKIIDQNYIHVVLLLIKSLWKKQFLT